MEKKRINIHGPAAKKEALKGLSFLNMFVPGLMCGLFMFMAVVMCWYSGNIIPGILCLAGMLGVIYVEFMTRDMKRSYIEIERGQITVVEYSFGRAKTTDVIQLSDIDHVEIIAGSSRRLKGRRASLGIPYLVFFGRDGKQLFKLLQSPEAMEFQESTARLRRKESKYERGEKPRLI